MARIFSYNLSWYIASRFASITTAEIALGLTGERPGRARIRLFRFFFPRAGGALWLAPTAPSLSIFCKRRGRSFHLRAARSRWWHYAAQQQVTRNQMAK